MEPERCGRLRSGTTYGRLGLIPLGSLLGHRARVLAAVSAAVASVLATCVAAGCGLIRYPLAPSTAIARASGTLQGPPPHLPGPAILMAPERTAAQAQRARPRPSWLIAPDRPLPRKSPWWRVLAVARGFAEADMSYEVGELGPAVRGAIAQTCTAAFGAELLSHRAILPPGVSPRQVQQRLVGVQPLERLRGAAVVLATVRATRRGGQPGAFELRLVVDSGGWRVAAMSVV